MLCWFLDAGNDETLGRLSWPASKKRQGTKSREVGHWLGSERYGDYMSGGTVKPLSSLLLRFLLFDRAARLSSAPTADFGRRRAQKVSRSAVALP